MIGQDKLEIQNTVAGQFHSCVLPRKLFIKITVCLVNIINMIVNSKSELHISRQICQCLDMSMDESSLDPNLVARLESLI